MNCPHDTKSATYVQSHLAKTLNQIFQNVVTSCVLNAAKMKIIV